MKPFIPVIVAVFAALNAAPAVAQQFNPAGSWYCTVNAQSNSPTYNYGFEVNMQVAQNGQLQAQGVVIYPLLANNLQKVKGYGDWTLLPSDNNNSTPLYKFRMQPQTHPIITWFVRPVGQGRMYNQFSGPTNDGGIVNVETQCQKTG